MKNICFFITHKTLNHYNAELTFHSFSIQNCDKKFNKLYIYNSHSSELSNQSLLTLFKKYSLNRFFDAVEVFDYDENTSKTLGGDILAIKNYCQKHYDKHDRVLLVKSDSLLSVNYFDDILNRISVNNLIYFVAPFINAKKRVTDEDILQYIKREQFIKSDDITFFVEDKNQSTNTDFYLRTDITINDIKIKFFSCYVVRDFSCHFLSIELMSLINISQQSWGGVSFQKLIDYLIETDRSFVVHKYHDIISENRQTDREGPVRQWFNN
jgi:hypothetical protein